MGKLFKVKLSVSSKVVPNISNLRNYLSNKKFSLCSLSFIQIKLPVYKTIKKPIINVVFTGYSAINIPREKILKIKNKIKKYILKKSRYFKYKKAYI